jgi:hypothetical protein
MTLYQRISPVYEAVQFKPGMSDRNGNRCLDEIFLDGCPAFLKGRPGFKPILLTNTATGERSVVSKEEFEREFREVVP